MDLATMTATDQVAVQTLERRRKRPPSQGLSSSRRSTGGASGTLFTPRDGTFKVKLQVPLTCMSPTLASREGRPVLWQEKDERFLLLQPDGPCAAACATLDALVRSTGSGGGSDLLGRPLAAAAG